MEVRVEGVGGPAPAGDLKGVFLKKAWTRALRASVVGAELAAFTGGLAVQCARVGVPGLRPSECVLSIKAVLSFCEDVIIMQGRGE